MMLEKTNSRIRSKIGNLKERKEHMSESSKYTVEGNKDGRAAALIGLMYLRGFYGLNHHLIDYLRS